MDVSKTIVPLTVAIVAGVLVVLELRKASKPKRDARADTQSSLPPALSATVSKTGVEEADGEGEAATMPGKEVNAKSISAERPAPARASATAGTVAEID
jgi:hypothetical protein